MTNEIIRLITSLMNRVPQSVLSSNDLAEVRTALEKQIPKKPIKDRRYTKELCPVCNDFVRLHAGTPMLFCCNCGQRLDWSEA